MSPEMDSYVVHDPADPDTVALCTLSRDQRLASVTVVSASQFQLNLTIEKEAPFLKAQSGDGDVPTNIGASMPSKCFQEDLLLCNDAITSGDKYLSSHTNKFKPFQDRNPDFKRHQDSVTSPINVLTSHFQQEDLCRFKTDRPLGHSSPINESLSPLHFPISPINATLSSGIGSLLNNGSSSLSNNGSVLSTSDVCVSDTSLTDYSNNASAFEHTQLPHYSKNDYVTSLHTNMASSQNYDLPLQDPMITSRITGTLNQKPMKSHQHHVTSHQSPLTSHQNNVTSHQYNVTSHQNPITSHKHKPMTSRQRLMTSHYHKPMTSTLSSSFLQLNMTVEKDAPGRDGSPVHVHVDEETPVHVHVKAGKPSTSGGSGTKKGTGKSASIEVSEGATL